jgi:hypothetical protein
MVMVVSFCVLGVYNMANGLEHIADILKRLNDELKLEKYKFEERTNVTTTILRPSNDATPSTRITTNGEQDEL